VRVEMKKEESHAKRKQMIK